MPEWTNGAVSKTAVVITGHRGFESLPFRLTSSLLTPARSFFYGGAVFAAVDETMSTSSRISTRSPV